MNIFLRVLMKLEHAFYIDDFSIQLYDLQSFWNHHKVNRDKEVNRYISKANYQHWSVCFYFRMNNRTVHIGVMIIIFSRTSYKFCYQFIANITHLSMVFTTAVQLTISITPSRPKMA